LSNNRVLKYEALRVME